MEIKKYLPYLAGLITFIIYLFTIAPSVIQIDSGELTAVQVLAGIAHPTGYPLFTISGYLWSLIPMPFSKVLQMNILAALFCSISVMIFIRTSFLVLNSREQFITVKAVKGKKRKQKEQPVKTQTTPDLYTIIAVLAGVFMLALSKTYWFQSTSVEVYSLHILLMMFIIYFLILSYLKGTNKIIDKYWLLFSLFLALGFTNHMTTMLILPGTAYLYFVKYGFNKSSLQRLAVMIGLFLAILAVIYSWLPLRASANPVLNWGNPVDMERILRHISGKQYQVWLFSSTESAKKQFVYFFSNLPSEFYFSLIAAAAGIIFSFRYMKRFSVFLIITFAATVLYSINYDIADIDSYFLLAYIALGFFSVIGVLKAIQYFYPEGKGYKTALVTVIALIILQGYFNFRSINQSGNYVFEDYTKAVLNNTTKDAVVLSYQWDYFISPGIYFQFVEGYRKDVTVIDKELLRRSWYFNQIGRNYPGILNGVRNDINLFLDALRPFERDEQFNSALLENLYRRIMTGLISTNIDKKDIYIAPELVENEMQKGEFQLPEGYTLVPDNLLFKVVKGNNYVAAADPDFRIRFPEKKDNYSAFIERVTGAMLTRRAMYELQFDKKVKAQIYINKILKDLPGYPLPQQLTEAVK